LLKEFEVEAATQVDVARPIINDDTPLAQASGQPSGILFLLQLVLMFAAVVAVVAMLLLLLLCCCCCYCCEEGQCIWRDFIN
jgi:hypothetical protein